MDVIIKNKNEEKLSCILKSNNSDKLFFIIPGEGENKNQRVYRKILKIVSELGYDVLVCDLSAMGKSEGNPSENSLDKRLSDFISIYDNFKKDYSGFYFLGFSFGALVGLVASTKINFEKQFLLSCALFSENRKAPKGFLDAWKKLGTLPDWKAFQKGIVKPAKQKLSFKFVKSLQKYKISNICKKVKSETFLICGDKEELFKKQNKQIYDSLNSKKQIKTIKNVNHNIGDKDYFNFIEAVLRKNL